MGVSGRGHEALVRDASVVPGVSDQASIPATQHAHFELHSEARSIRRRRVETAVHNMYWYNNIQ